MGVQQRLRPASLGSRVLALAGVLGPVEAVLGLGLWLASRERRRLGSMQGAARPIGLGRGEAPKV